MRKRFLVFILFLFVFQACNKDFDPPELREIKDVTIKNLSEGIAELHAEALFHNPNKVKVRLREVRIKVFIDEKEAAVIDQKMKVVIPPRADFSVPIDVNVALKELGLVNTLLSVFGGKKMKVRYVGHMKLSYHGIIIKVPVDHQEELNIQL